MSRRILVMGLPGSGKTTFSNELFKCLKDHDVVWYNADEIRKLHNDWDFSSEGRLRQAQRMRNLSDNNDINYVIADFVCPLQTMRETYDAHWTIWMDTIELGRYEDTNKMFQQPTSYDFRISEFDAKKFAPIVAHAIINNIRYQFDWQKPTVQMLGRWQPWHTGHRKLFERAIAKTEQVAIMVRNCHDEKNPFSFEQVERNIRRNLDAEYRNRYIVLQVPNIVNITYGRDVGYVIEQERFEESVENISATKIRKELGL